MKKGFTMIEILISISIISLLTAVGIVSYVTMNTNARDAKRRGDIEQIRAGLELYRADLGYYPSTGDGSAVSASTLVMTDYIAEIPTDPKSADSSHAYLYKATNYSASMNNWYGYCLYAQMENTGLANAICDSKPVGTPAYNFGAKNP